MDTIVFDFDGTIAIGHGPVLAYARFVADVLGTDGAAFTHEIADELRRVDREGSFAGEVLDGYGLVHSLGTAAGVSPERLASAYQDSRTLLGTAGAPIIAPEGLAVILDMLAATSTLVLLTNAPSTNLDDALDVLGLSGRFAAIHSSAGKPDGLRRRAEGWLAEGRLLSVGDIWENDLAPVADLGGDTALVGVAAPHQNPVYASATLPGLYADMLAWAGLEQSPRHLMTNRTAPPREKESTRR